MADVLKALQIDAKKALVLVAKADKTVFKSGRNIPRLNVLEAAKASTYEILNGGILVLQKSSVDVIQKTFAKN
jgi:large subunit ribosomal protein L4